ncbi:hypothetical protein LOTGIDRAFT_187793 [Lottia gigantea]|uniref:Amino acid transporter n=1 Tax=Lottia gigantea TaxID=225164 RepID=V4C701_LOTGI|nr:hypothetical protein LOTGIDRAFT_187793 [Lottia gigantea]ESO97439.1 hypothetical protein LOTGIDRAFT_187793 [Lottia gigantea]
MARGKDICNKSWWLTVLKTNLLVLLTLTGAIIGFALGIGLRSHDLSQDAVIWIGIPGEMYMRSLKMMILPLIICSVIAGTASLDPKSNGKISIVALVYILATNCLPCLVGMAMALIIRPGEGVDVSNGQRVVDQPVMETSDIFADLFRNVFPDNIVAASFQQSQTKYEIQEEFIRLNVSGNVVNNTVIEKLKKIGVAYSTNVLGIVVCCLLFGIATTSVGELGRPFFLFFHSASEIILKILRWMVWATPVGVASLIAVALIKSGGLVDTFKSMGMFTLTIASAIAVYQLLIVPLYYFIIMRTNPYKFLISMSRPWMVSFATASSAVAIPETLNCLEQDNHVDKRISRFVVPLASTINRDGSALYITAACIFVAQLTGVDLDGGKIVLIWVLTTVISLAVPSVPSAGVMAVLINLTALGIPGDNIGLLFAMEWLLDRIRTGSNMLSHACCAMVVFKLCKSSLPPLDEEMEIMIRPDNVEKPELCHLNNLEVNENSEKTVL